jgi:hypothetical protein
MAQSIKLAFGSLYAKSDTFKLPNDFVSSYLSQIDIIQNNSNNIDSLSIECIANFLANENKKQKYSLPKNAFKVCAQRLMPLANIDIQAASGITSNVKNLKSSINSINDFCLSTNTLVAYKFKEISKKTIAMAEIIDTTTFPQSQCESGRDRIVLFEAAKIIRETLGYFPTNSTLVAIVSLLVKKNKSRQWVENNLKADNKQKIEDSIKKTWENIYQGDQNKPLNDNICASPSEEKLSEKMALSKIRNIIHNMEDQELAEFLLIRLDEAKNDWGI